MKSFKTILVLACFLLMLPITTQAQDDENFILNLTEFTVKFGHNSNFTDGVKKWNKCYKENDGKEKWNVWHRLQGKGNVYVMASSVKNWAEMDESDPAGKACRAIAISSIVPYIKSAEFNTARPMLEISKKDPLGDNTIVWVNSFTVKSSMAFNEIIEDVSSTVKAEEGKFRAYWYRNMAGEGMSYFVSTPFKDFADLDKERAGVWEIYEKAHGKAKTKEIREKFYAVLKNSSSYTYTLEKDLSMQ
ncbi:hypothetical protein EYD45_00445 [Hyunsoonleella flava]|uniref:Uncharacterized protein n=1 Tax=Hyunsoonleella flava TaxID=2527939 RepID=A0A4Q9FLC9_9FLAO|nr:hypothetical protein [Hyunsoonleella flava]TBN06390.1 hypothetical protein EYD45_00445 [Hyunsoonleella flava]